MFFIRREAEWSTQNRWSVLNAIRLARDYVCGLVDNVVGDIKQSLKR